MLWRPQTIKSIILWFQIQLLPVWPLRLWVIKHRMLVSLVCWKKQVFKTPLISFKKKSAEQQKSNGDPNNNLQIQEKFQSKHNTKQKHSKSKSNKKQCSQPDYYKGLENFVLTSSNTSKLQFSRKNKKETFEPSDIFSSKPISSGNVCDRSVSLTDKSPQLEKEVSTEVITLNKLNKSMRLGSGITKDSSAIVNQSSVRVDCGVCIQCLNKQRKK